jgi:hypothetical protein
MVLYHETKEESAKNGARCGFLGLDEWKKGRAPADDGWGDVGVVVRAYAR